jgi:hypothetical protein
VLLFVVTHAVNPKNCNNFFSQKVDFQVYLLLLSQHARLCLSTCLETFSPFRSPSCLLQFQKKMKLKVSKDLLPIKAHYFFFMGSLGPILPQMVLFGRQLGVSPTVMGFFLSMLPFLYFFAKPLVGWLADYFSVSADL